MLYLLKGLNVPDEVPQAVNALVNSKSELVVLRAHAEGLQLVLCVVRIGGLFHVPAVHAWQTEQKGLRDSVRRALDWSGAGCKEGVMRMWM